ncbi:Ig-like domain-containing protein, partial [Nitrosomonas sp. ANs5]|uniref:Ig-like domain-containing protein n=1 Tax=Nitrosomonas sp. ANs5 TaxID=3423941 RepID=UPI003D345F54
PYFGHGRVDAGAAVQAVVTTETTITPSKDTEPPRVSILEPLSGATVSGLVPVDIEATDNVGVVRTELWVNHTSVAVDTSEPFAFSWDSNGTPNGKANLVVRAFDAAGNSAASNIAEVNVENPISSVTDDKDTSSSLIDTTPPVVQIINPVGGNVSHNVTITVNASDDNGDADIALAIYIDGQRFATGTGSTLSANWNTRPKRVSAGAHTIQATAKDAAGNTATTSVNVNVVK